MIRKSVSIFLFLFVVISAHAQDSLYSLRSNPVVKKFHKDHPDFVFGQKNSHLQGKHGIGDTLQLPFFDDFSTGDVITLDTLWTNYSVFINSDFPVNPPSVGVATFDGLDEFGNAYGDINPNFFAGADTLTSQPINLSSFTLPDSIYLSFFYQPQGYSYEVLQASDSLVLQFKNQIGAWVNVWSTPGKALQPFKIAMVTLPNATYLHSGFQFRFINYMKYIGNLKQWHLDYVYMNQGRTRNDTLFEDQALAYKPPFPFASYTHLPWNHLKTNFNKHIFNSYVLTASNLSSSGETFSIELQARDGNNNQVGFQKLAGSTLPANSHTEFTLNPAISMTSNSADSSEITMVGRIGDILGGNDVRRNDSAVRKVELANYFAYDDGTAETGYGIRNGSGSVAYGFDLEFADTLRAVSIHFTQAEALAKNSFFLMVWQNIAPVGQPSTGVDKVLLSRNITLPQYIDSINGYYTIYLDTPQYITGRFYIGWRQNSAFMLNVGFDRNYRYLGQDTASPNLFYNVKGKWERATISGTLMMRPHVGAPISEPLSVSEPAVMPETIRVYPNPAKNRLNIHLETGSIQKVEILDISGKTLRIEEASENAIELGELSPGIYLYRVYSNDGKVYFGKFIKEN